MNNQELPSWALPAPDLRIGQTVHIAMNAPEYQTGQICDIDPSRPNGDIYAVAIDGITFEDGTNINYYWREHLEVIDSSHFMPPHIPGRGYETEEPVLTACPWCGAYHEPQHIPACPLKPKHNNDTMQP